MLKLRILFVFFLCSAVQSYGLTYQDMDKNSKDVAKDQLTMFAFHTTGYLATQWDTIQDEGSWDGYQDRLFEFQFDSDSSTWNFFGHGLTGAQVYLFYRAKGYSRSDAFQLGFLSSLYFEVLIENYTEAPSFQDTFHTPIYGALIGHVLELTSVELINSDYWILQALGRILNPFSFLVEDEDEMKSALMPVYGPNKSFGLTWVAFYD